ncbi:MAG: MFS transporter [Gammaproteobacteria bacterium]|nr:MFS transporter [Gammaproteobacteria bacterium]
MSANVKTASIGSEPARLGAPPLPLNGVAGAWSLFLGIAFIMVANGLQGTLLAVRASIEGFSTPALGLMMSSYFVGMLCGGRLAPLYIERVGHIRVFAACASVGSVSILVHGMHVEPISWAAMRFITGVCYAGLFIVAESWLNARATNESRGGLLSLYMMVVFGGAAGGQLLLNAASPSGLGLFILTSMLISLALVPLLLSLNPAPAFDAGTRVSISKLYQRSPLGVVSTLGAGLSHGAIFGMGAVFAVSTGMDTSEVAWFMAAHLGGAIISQWPIGRLSDRVDRRWVLAGVSLLAALAAASGAPFIEIEAVMYIMGFALGTMALPLYSLAIAYTNDRLLPEETVRAAGTLVVVAGVGLSLGPVTAAMLMTYLGPEGFLYYLVFVHLGIVVFALFRMTQRASHPVDEQSAFVMAAPRGSPVAVALVAEEGMEARDEEDSTEGA